MPDAVLCVLTSATRRCARAWALAATAASRTRSTAAVDAFAPSFSTRAATSATSAPGHSRPAAAAAAARTATKRRIYGDRKATRTVAQTATVATKPSCSAKRHTTTAPGG